MNAIILLIIKILISLSALGECGYMVILKKFYKRTHKIKKFSGARDKFYGQP